MSELSENQLETLETARAGVEAYQRGDIEAVVALIHEEGEIFLPPELPNSGTYRGRDGFLVWLANWLDAWEDFNIELRDPEPVGQRHVVATMHQSARGKGSGIPVEMDIAYMWEVRDGKVAAMHLYASAERAVRVAEQRERGGAVGNPESTD
jgi:ketosteroid isomerase-like protein